MATSGTIGATVIDTVKVIDHAVRRCGANPATLSPEQVDMARENLYLILTSIINRGVNLWAVDTQLIGLNENHNSYDCPPGTVDVLNVNYTTGFQLTFTGTQGPDNYTAVFDSPTPVKRVGMYFNVTRLNNFVFECSNDGTDGSWSAVATLAEFTGYVGTWYWFSVDPSFAVPYFRIRETSANVISAPVSFAQVVLMQTTSEIPMYKMNRDTYLTLPNKNVPGRPVQYFYDKQISPKITLNPVPNDVYAHLSMTRHRYIQDVGDLDNKLEIPERWFEAIIWMLSKNCCYELPGVDTDRIQLVERQAEKYLNEAEDGETDGSPIFLQPKISGYTA